MILSAFFSGMEIAFVSSSRLQAEIDKGETNGFAQHCLDKFYHNPNGFVSTMLVGNNIVLVVYGILFAQIFDQLWQYLGVTNAATLVIIDTLSSTLVVLFTGEFLPKLLFKSNPNKLLTLFAPLAYLFYIILWPISVFATCLSRCMLRLVGVKIPKEEEAGAFTKVDLDYLVQSSIDNAKDDDDIDDEEYTDAIRIRKGYAYCPCCGKKLQANYKTEITSNGVIWIIICVLFCILLVFIPILSCTYKMVTFRCKHCHRKSLPRDTRELPVLK